MEAVRAEEGEWVYEWEGVQVRQDPMGTEAAGVGSTVWDSALCVSRYVLRTWAPAARKVLELGAGTGLLGLVLARAHLAKSICLTDRSNVVPLISQNIHRNHLQHVCSAVQLDWEQWKHALHLRRTCGPFDWIIASDVVYQPDMFEPLLQTFFSLTTPGHTQVLLGYEQRNPAQEQEFFDELQNGYGFVLHRVPASELDPDFYSDDLHVYIASLPN